MFRHTKLSYDPSLDYEKICRELFGENRYLCVAEKMNINAHVHFQGETNLTEREYDDKFTLLVQDHYLKKSNPKARPVRHVRSGDVDELGYQYMCKENPPNVLAKNRFDEEEIQALHEQSECHVDELKCGLKRKLHQLSPELSPQSLHRRYRREAGVYYETSDKMPPPNVQKLILWAMYTSPGASLETKDYVMERI